jgi:hypothetical protein
MDCFALTLLAFTTDMWVPCPMLTQAGSLGRWQRARKEARQEAGHTFVIQGVNRAAARWRWQRRPLGQSAPPAGDGRAVRWGRLRLPPGYPHRPLGETGAGRWSSPVEAPNTARPRRFSCGGPRHGQQADQCPGRSHGPQ